MRGRSFSVVLLMMAHGAWADYGTTTDNSTTIVSKTLELEREHAVSVDPTVEYVFKFLPNVEQGQYPMRVWLHSSAGDVTRPLLLTARQRTGAVTWQLPHVEGTTLHFEMERTLCPDDAVDTEPSECAGAEWPQRRGAVSLHVSSSCAAAVVLRVRVEPARDWQLVDKLHYSAALSAPHVARYRFAEEQASVRLVVASPDDLCATVAVQPYTCPIAQTFEEIRQAMTRMTVLRSGAVQLSKSRYPRGFFVSTLVADRDEACRGAAPEDGAWLWDSVWQGEARREPASRPRVKHLTLEIKPSLSRAEYAVGAAVTLSFFLAFYVLFGVLVLAVRWPRWYRCVAPQAVLHDPHRSELGAAAGQDAAGLDAAGPDTSPDAAGAARRRRGSTATFDSSDASDSDSADETTADPVVNSTTTAITHTSSGSVSVEPGGGDTGAVVTNGAAAGGGVAGADSEPANGRVVIADAAQETAEVTTDGERPFGLPARLRVAALARRRARVLRARSQRYLYTLATVAVFYALPVLQFVAAFQVILNVSGSLDLCYYNFLCAHPLGALSDFNHVLSNLGYLLLGALYMLQLRRRRARRARRPRHEEYGIPPQYGLSAALGAGLMMVALLSASYHVCPNALNFQFDTAFMYVLAVLSMVRTYQARHPDIAARAHATFAVLAVLIALVVWGVLGGGPLFWSVFTVLHVFTFLLLSLRIYYVGQFRLEKAHLAAAAAAAAALRRGGGARPLYTARLVALLLANAVNWAFALYGLITQKADIASHLLFVLLSNALLHAVYYLGMKLLHGERLRWYAWLHLAGAAAAWAPALYFFLSDSTDWASTAAQSRDLNRECRVLHFYDSHDLWHILSAVALYLTFNAMLTWDDGLSAVKRTDIAVF